MDNKGSAIVIVIIAMALVGMLAMTILWSACLNYRIKMNDLEAKSGFYSAETIVEQIAAGIRRDVVSVSVNKAYREVVSNWDALGTDTNRASYFMTAYIESVEKELNVSPAKMPGRYDKDKLYGYVDGAYWDTDNPEGYIRKSAWDAAVPVFEPADAQNGYSSMVIKNICVEFYDGNGYLSVINTDLAIDVPKLRFTQAGDIDRLYPYVLVGGTGIEFADGVSAHINGNIYGGVDDGKEGGIRIGENGRVTIEDASYLISGGDIVVGSPGDFTTQIHQGAELIVRDVLKDGKGFSTNIYAQGIELNGSRLDMAGRMYLSNDLTLSGRGSSAFLAGQYYGYGDTNTAALEGEGLVNPANSSSAIVINGRDSTVDLTGLTALVLAGRAYVSLPQDDGEGQGLPHVLMGESISVKSNQIAYLVPPECVGTLDGKAVIGTNPVPFDVWMQMISDLPAYEEKGSDFKIVDASKETDSLGGERLDTYGIADITAGDLGGTDASDLARTITRLNGTASKKGVRFLYMPGSGQVYLYLVMDHSHAGEYFMRYYHVESNKVNLDRYFNQYVSGGIRMKEGMQGYTIVGNSMVSALDGDFNDILTSEDGQNLVRLLPGTSEEREETGQNPGKTDEMAANYSRCYTNLDRNLSEEDAGLETTVFENLVRLHVVNGSPEGVVGLQDYLDGQGGIVYFSTGEGANVRQAVLVDSNRQPGHVYRVDDAKLRLVIAIGDVEVARDFQGLIIASGRITVTGSVTIKKDGEGVYAVLQAKSENSTDANIPANVLYNGQGMILGGYEAADVDEEGNLNIDYSKIVRYENWIKK